MRVSHETMTANADAIENCIDEYYEENGISPSIEVIAAETGISKSTVGRYLQKMTNEGRLISNGKRGYATKRMQQSSNMELIPILGNIACGAPIFADGTVKEYVRLPASLLGSGNYFILTASGDSMIEAGIDDGDTVIVKQQDYAEVGDIVVALVGDDATLKRYYPEPERKRIRLQPENENHEPIYVRECLIQGIAVTVWKNLK